jgi:hypothetical protein
MKRFQMHGMPETTLGRNDAVVMVRQSPQARVTLPCRPCEEKRRRDLEARREPCQPS